MDIVLALGGGGSKGNAHIGVLRVLEREGFNIRAIAGTSAGGMAAAAYAAGFDADALEAHMCKHDQSKFYALHLGDKPAFFGVDGIARALSELIEERSFADLNIPCAVNAVDMKTHREVILNPVPVSVARAISPEKNLPVVAVSLTPALDDDVEIHSLNLVNATPILKPISNLKVAQVFDIFISSIEMGLCAITDLRLEIDQPDVIIRPRVEHVGYLERVDIREVVKLGERAAEEMLPALRRVARRRKRPPRRRKSRNP